MEQLKTGDIIVISHFITPDNKKLNQHSFIVLQNEKGKIAGVEINLDLELEFDLVTVVMSSIKNEEHKKKIESYYPKDMIVEFNDAQVTNGNQKDGFIKVNQLYYFNKKNIEYTKIGCLKEETLVKLFDLLQKNDINGDLINNYNNIIKNAEKVES